MNLIRNIVYLLVLFSIACVPVIEEPLREVRIDFNDPVYRKIYNFQDSQQLDSLLQYMNHRDPSYRYAVASAFGSFQTSDALEPLKQLLMDSIKKVQIAAAYSLGQLGAIEAENALIEAFIQKDTLSVNNERNKTILEAVGKCGTENSLSSLASVETYRIEDENLLLGMSRGIYRFGLRGITTDKGTEKMVSLVLNQEMPIKARLVAANYLSRFQDIDLSNWQFQLAELIQKEEDANIRLALVRSLSRSSNRQILNILLQQLNSDSDYRVKCNILRSLGNHAYIRVIQSVLNTLSDSNIHVAKSAVEYLMENGNSTDAPYYLNYARRNLPIEVKAGIYESVLKNLPLNSTGSRTRVINEIRRIIERTENPYHKAAFIKAISQDLRNFRLLRDLSFSNEHAVVRTTGVEGFRTILTNENWNRIYGSTGRSNRVKREISLILKEAIESGDMAMIASASGILSNEDIGFKPIIESPEYLKDVRNELVLPKDVEAFMAIDQTIKYFFDEEGDQNVDVGFSHPIDWALLEGISDTTYAMINTGKGNIKIKFFEKEAPGTVANFIQLVNENFYDEKLFHRVVPSFVIQGGCTRGDGYGSLDYTIRSELAPLYYDKEGRIGMASAGKHTESAQFFITHAPAMHLDGKYTIFAEVVEGMNVVHDIQVGDKITDVIIYN